MIKKRVAFLMTFLIILSTLGGSVYAESRTFGNEGYPYDPISGLMYTLFQRITITYTV